MGTSKNISPWNHSSQRVYLEDKKPMPSYDSIKLAKKGRGAPKHDQTISRGSGLKIARKNHCAIS